MKNLLIVVLLMTLATASFGQTAYRYGDTVSNVRGDVIGGASVTVYNANTTTKATLYSSATPALGELGNPTSSDTFGRFYFYVLPGLYDVQISGTGITTYTVEDVRVWAEYSRGFDITDYGAIAGDDIDDSAAFDLAIAAAGVTGGRVYVPEGSFTLEDSVLVDYDDVVIGGDGPASRIVLADTDGLWAFRVEADDVTIRDLALVGSIADSNVTNSEAIEIQSGTDRLAIQNVLITGTDADHGFSTGIRGRVYTSELKIAGCTLERIRGTDSGYGYGVELARTDRSVISNNTSSFEPGHGRHHFYLSSGSTGNTISANTCTGGQWQQISCYSYTTDPACYGNVIDGNTLMDSADMGIVFSDHVHSSTISNNIIHSPNDYGIFIQQSNVADLLSHHNTVIGNQIYDCSVRAIYLLRGESNSLIGNTVVDAGIGSPGTEAAIVLDPGSRSGGADSTMVVGNMVRGSYHRYALTLNGSGVSAYANSFDEGTTATFNNHTPDDQHVFGNRVSDEPVALMGSGTPEGAVTAPIGSFYQRSDGGAGTSFYVKESGTGNTGWVAK